MSEVVKVISSALISNHSKINIEDVLWQEVYTASHAHLLHFVVFDYYNIHWSEEFKKSCLYKKWRQEFVQYVTTQSYEYRNTLKLLERLQNKGFEFIMLKGPTISELYFNSNTRIMSDIDILINPEHLEQVELFFLESGFNCINKSDKDYVFFKKGFLKIELHFSLFHKKHYNDFRWFEDECFRNKLKHNDLPGYVLAPSDSLTYIIIHAAKHITSTGTGLRSLFDIWIYYVSNCSEINFNRLEQNLIKFNRYTLSQYLFYLSNIQFGEKFDVKMEINTDVASKLLDILFNSGAYGHWNNSQVDMIYVNNYVKVNNVFLKKMYAIFLPLSEMKKRFEVLKEKPYLLPIYWYKRGVLILKKNKNLSSKFIKSNLRFDDIKEKKEVISFLLDDIEMES